MSTLAPATPSSTPSTNSPHFSVLIVGGGTAGITVAAQLHQANAQLAIAIIEPSQSHYYQPAWTLVGAGEMSFAETERQEASCIPTGVTWVQAGVTQFEPEANTVVTTNGLRLTYDALVVCPGIQINWTAIPGLAETLGKNNVCSNYAVGGATYTYEVLNQFQGGTALFTFPATPIKCAGAPQKIMYLADEIFRKNGVRDKTQIIYACAVGKIFAVDAFAKTLMQVAQRKGIELRFLHNLVAVDGDRHQATFAVTENGETRQISLGFDLLHVAPPMGAPDFIRTSPLAVPEAGWVDVDKYTLQHNRYANIFSLGDASSLPTSKTAAAVRRQAPVLVANLLAHLARTSPTARYNGYTCCPLVTGFGKTIMAEFGYDGVLMPSFPIDQTQEQYSMWVIKRHVLPWVYWNRMLKGGQHEGNYLKWLRVKA